MPVPKKERTTSNTTPQAGEQASQPLPDQQTFHEHLRALTRNAVRVVIEEVMQEELIPIRDLKYNLKVRKIRHGFHALLITSKRIECKAQNIC